MEGSPSSLPPPRHRKGSDDSPETPTRPPAFRPDAVRGRGEDPPAEDGIGRPRLPPSRQPLPNPRFPSLKIRPRRNPPPQITNTLPPRQRRKKKKKKMLQEEEEEEEKKEEEEAVVPPAPPPSSPKWNLRSRRRPAASGLPFRPLPDRDNPLPMRRRSPTFFFELSKAEIKNDFLRITGKGPRPRPTKRRPRSIQLKLDPLLPGEFLWNARKNWRDEDSF